VTAAGVGPLDRRHLEPASPFGRVTVRAGEAWLSAAVVDHAPDVVRVAVDGASELRVTLRSDGEVWSGLVGDEPFAAVLVGDVVDATVGGWRLKLEAGHDGVATDEAGGHVAVAPMPGAVVALRAAPGQAVAKGELLLVIEAMKTENRVLAPRDGIVLEVRCSVGDVVAAEQVLVVLGEAKAG
jgi:propionyl-CoA carboxylase alpha chain/3-methylcrotonyl-CoA carboxylase alpha subunit